MRNLSYLFLALGALSPLITWGVAGRARDNYAARFGEALEGSGLFGIIALGAMATFALFALSTIFGIRSYRTLDPPRAFRRKFELTLLCLPPLVVLLWVCVCLLGLPQEAPPVIHTR